MSSQRPSHFYWEMLVYSFIHSNKGLLTTEYWVQFLMTKIQSWTKHDKTLSWHLSGWPKIAFSFLGKNKVNIFHFHQELYWTTYSASCSTTFCHFSDNFIIPSSQNLLSFWAKNCSRCLLQSSRELKFFPLRGFCKDWNKWKSEGAMSGEYDRWIRTSQPSCVTVFAWSSKKHAVLCYPDGRLCIFCWLILHVLRWVLLSVRLIGSSSCWN